MITSISKNIVSVKYFRVRDKYTHLESKLKKFLERFLILRSYSVDKYDDFTYFFSLQDPLNAMLSLTYSSLHILMDKSRVRGRADKFFLRLA